MPSVNFIAMRCESTSWNGIAADKSHCVAIASDISGDSFIMTVEIMWNLQKLKRITHSQ